ncbi:MAG: hypothetical protein L0154_12375 [Chloroflexi bacterium]|nr:hypothetical protein [Chloroflexota bacterium]
MPNEHDEIQSPRRQDEQELPANALHDTYAAQQALFEAQPRTVQHFLEMQARMVAEALRQDTSQLRFNLPDHVALDTSGQTVPVPAQFHQQTVGGLITSVRGADIRSTFRHHLIELENADEPSVAVAAQLLRHATAIHMVYDMLPSGRSVKYVTAEGEEIPTLPAEDEAMAQSAIAAETDAIAEEGTPEERGELVVPYVPAARRFYLPQWVAFDEEGHILVTSTQAAEAHIASMQQFINVLHAAVALAPYMVADGEYQRKRYGILGQLINQGRALALYQTTEIIDTIKRRAAANDLNRGLSLSLPYFDDQTLQMKMHDFVVIPAGRIMFVPALVVRAVHEEQAKVAQDTRLSTSTRKYLLNELQELGEAIAKRPGSNTISG